MHHEAPRRSLMAWGYDLFADARYAGRVFRRQPVIVSLVLLGLAASIGVSTTVFSIVNAFNFRPLGVANPASVVRVIQTVAGRGSRGWSIDDYRRLRDASSTVSVEATVATGVSASLHAGDRDARIAQIRFVSGGFAEAFGARAALGRTLTASDDATGAAPAAFLMHAFWNARLASDPAIVGRTLYLNDVPVSVAGVFQPDFTGPFDLNESPGIVMAMPAAAVVAPYEDPLAAAHAARVEVIGRLTPSATIASANAEVAAIAAANGWTRPAAAGAAPASVTVQSAPRATSSESVAIIAIVMTIVALVLTVASTNVANLLLASATTRHLEIGARLALGASRGRLIRQLLTESVLLASVGGAAGFVVAAWLTPAAVRLLEIPNVADLSPDLRVFLFVAVVSGAVGAFAGLAPARYGARGDVTAVLGGGSARAGGAPGARRLRSVFLGLQAAASVMLLVLTALFSRALVAASSMDFGFPIDELVAVSASDRTGSTATVSSAEYWPAAVDRVRSLPSVRAAALTEHPPFDASFHPVPALLDGRRYPVVMNRASPEFFETMGLRILYGRGFTAGETASNAKVAVISERMARDFWPNGDALGATLQPVTMQKTEDVRVIGIVPDVASMVRAPFYHRAGVIYVPLAREGVPQLVVRMSDLSAGGLRVIEDAMAAIDPARRPRASPVRDGLREHLTRPRILASVAGVVGGLALALAAIGVFGVTAFVVGQRRREIAIRLAMGAASRDVVRLIVGQGLRPVVIGLACGIIVAVGATRVVASVLYAGISARDPLAFAGATLVLLVAAGAGVWIPARRAARLDPARVLRD